MESWRQTVRGRRKCPLARRGRVGDVTTWLSQRHRSELKRGLEGGVPGSVGDFFKRVGYG